MPVYNFYAGPSPLPKAVVEAVIEDIRSFDGLSGIMETSHRSPQFEQMSEALNGLVAELLGIDPGRYDILWTTGGATECFSSIPANFLHAKAAYIDTGIWSTKAYEEAVKFGKADVVASGKEGGYRAIPAIGNLDPDYDYVHLTSNNTIIGTSFKSFPEHANLIADMSSDLFSRQFEINNFKVIYAAAQKNFGTSGTTLVILQKDFLNDAKDAAEMSPLVSYKSVSKSRSLYNTPPNGPLICALRMLEWIKAQGGVAAMEARAEERSRRIYKVLDSYGIYIPFADGESRSHMNLTFNLKDHEDEFAEESKRFLGIQGHRAVGGFRINMYNGISPDAVSALEEFLVSFGEKHA